MKQLFQAIGFLTVLPAPVTVERDGVSEFGRCAVWFPFIGVVIGAFLAGIHFGAAWLFPRTALAHIITVVAWTWITGGLHLDGLADCCDGLFVSAGRERRLEIMRDPRMGAFGVIGLVLFLLAKVIAVSALRTQIEYIDYHFLFPLLFAPVLARYTCLLVAKQPPARPGGMGEAFARQIGPIAFILGAIPVIGLIFLDANPMRAGFAVCFGLTTTVAVMIFARRRLGGMTGDVLGLSIELTELSVLLTYASKLA